MDFDGIMRRVRAEFLEMPGLRLTPVQARRLWGLDGDACHAVIEALVACAFLKRTPGGSVARDEP